MRLPNGYTEVQYIQSTGTQYIDTEFKPNQDSRVIAKLSTLETGSHTVFGADLSWTDNGFALGTGFTHYGKETGTISGLANGSPHEVDFNKNTISIDGSTVLTMGTSTFSVSYNLALFANNRAGGIAEKTIMVLYYFQIYNGNTIVRDYIPCINPDGEAGLYDMVNSKFYGNAGTGVFFAGPPRVSLPSGYKQLEYIQGTGSQYLNTDAKPNQNTRLVADFEVLSWPSSQFLGARTSPANTAFNILISSATSGRDDWNTSAISFTSENARWKIDKNKNVTAIDSSVTTHATGSFSCPVPIYLFAVNNNGSLMATGCAGAKCYSCQIYDNTTLIRDYIPCMNPAGAIGLYDLVNSKFYANAGTGVFTAGPEVTWPSNDAIYVKVNGIWRQIDGIKLL